MRFPLFLSLIVTQPFPRGSSPFLFFPLPYSLFVRAFLPINTKKDNGSTYTGPMSSYFYPSYHNHIRFGLTHLKGVVHAQRSAIPKGYAWLYTPLCRAGPAKKERIRNRHHANSFPLKQACLRANQHIHEGETKERKEDGKFSIRPFILGLSERHSLSRERETGRGLAR